MILLLDWITFGRKIYLNYLFIACINKLFYAQFCNFSFTFWKNTSTLKSQNKNIFDWKMIMKSAGKSLAKKTQTMLMHINVCAWHFVFTKSDSWLRFVNISINLSRKDKRLREIFVFHEMNSKNKGYGTQIYIKIRSCITFRCLFVYDVLIIKWFWCINNFVARWFKTKNALFCTSVSYTEQWHVTSTSEYVDSTWQA